MPPRQDNAPSQDPGWHFGTPEPGNRNNIKCKLCDKVVKGGITRLKQHLGHIKGNVAPCARAPKDVRDGMRKLLEDAKAKKIDTRSRRDEFESSLRGGGDDDIEGFIDEDAQIRRATQESVRSHSEWEERERFRQQTGGSHNVYGEGGSSHARGGSGTGSGSGSRQQVLESDNVAFRMRSTDIDLARSQSSRQRKITGGLMKTLRKKLGEAVSKFIIYERLPMSLSNSPWLHNLIQAATEIGTTGVKFPTPYEISDVYLESEYKSMKEWINDLRGAWKERGVTIMCDGWTDGINHTHIINFLVYSSQGTIFLKSVNASSVDSINRAYYLRELEKVVDEVGEEFVVQVVTDNESALKAAGRDLMERRPHIYWSPCAAHCIDLCLEDIGKKSNVKKVLEEAKMISSFIYNHTWTVNLMKEFTRGNEIIRPAVTRFATQFLQLQSIVKHKQALKDMINSERFRHSKFGKAKSGPAYDVRKKILENNFWNKAGEILKVFEPLVKVLRLVDGDEKPTMGFIYEAIYRAKQAIEQNCRYHEQYNAMVDARWKFLHTDLHAAGYYLNPQFQFGIEHGESVLHETFQGTHNVISKLERDVDAQIRAINQLMLFRYKKETFGTIQAQRARTQMDPTEWWIVYGTCAPDLQKIAIKVLSQTTSASNCERNWSTFSYIHTKTRNRLKYQKLQKLVFTFYNMKLKMRFQRRNSQEDIENSFNPINLDYIFQLNDPLTEWLEEREDPLLDGVQNSEWLPRVDSDDDSTEDDNGDGSDNGGDSSGSGSGLSPPTNNSGDGDGGGNGGNAESSHDMDERRQHDPYQENPYPEGFCIDISSLPDIHPTRRGRRAQELEDSISSNFSHGFSDFGIGESSQSSQGQYPPFHEQSFYPPQPYYQPHMYYHPQTEQGGGFVDYIFGQGVRPSDTESETRGYDPPRHSTMW